MYRAFAVVQIETPAGERHPVLFLTVSVITVITNSFAYNVIVS